MLAERKKKVIYSNNPRGTHWANDSQKFGQKMLKSMGWEEGKGLGKNGDGITENIKASFKFDNNGFGFKRKLNDFIEENNVYEQILSDLAQHHANPQIASKKTTEVSDAEQKAPKMKSIFKHHHRSKFIRAKNQSMQSEKDLFCIFPTSKTTSSETKEQSSNTESSSSETESKSEQTIEVKSTMPQMTTVESKVSIDDYFKQKMMKRRLKQQDCTDNNNEKTTGQSEAVDDSRSHETELYRNKQKNKKKNKQKHIRLL